MKRLKQLKRIPKFRSRKEEREFWETHDTTEYFDEEDFIKLAPHVKDIKLIHIYVAPDRSRWIMIPDSRKSKQIAGSNRTAFLVD